MTQIPTRVFATWENGINVHDCFHLMKKLKLECSKCSRLFDGEFSFKCHIERCLKNSVRDRNYLVHMYANRLLVLQHRLALYCGVTEETDYRQCGLCKMEFANYAELKRHLRFCRTYNFEYGAFMQKTQILFDNLLLSYDALGEIFQKFKNDVNVIKYREIDNAPPLPIPFPRFHPIPSKSNRLEEFFAEKTQMFYFSLLDFSIDVFIRYLKKREEEVEDTGIDYLQKDPYVNVYRSEEENGNDTETDYETEEEREDEQDVEVVSDDELDEEVDSNTSAAETEDEYVLDEFGEEMEYDEDDDEIIDVVGIDEHEIVFQPFVGNELAENDEEDEYIDVVM